MNIIFWVSSIPNHRMVSGISAADRDVAAEERERREGGVEDPVRPREDAEGTPTTTASPKPGEHAAQRRVDAVEAAPAPASRLGKLWMTSPGLGSTTGEMRRVSGVAPTVTAHHTRTTQADGAHADGAPEGRTRDGAEREDRRPGVRANGSPRGG